ncbi:hypothetical protein QFC21_002220 [Naganishia friedmannii]|uniref:Uncharacterized protein n=1 Tax=Naganishia friedmannii TaxID=89922 RepID=A0ACC2VX77_9TREE|nr:hypothetical protein QFC21_002220 [Naganishia friedmannii]
MQPEAESIPVAEQDPRFDADDDRASVNQGDEEDDYELGEGVHADDPDWAEKLLQEAMLVTPEAATTSNRVLVTMLDVVEWAKVESKHDVGKEMAKEGIYTRMRAYMTYRVDNGRKVQPVGEAEKIVHMNWNTLTQLRWDLVGLVTHKAAPAFTTEARREVIEELCVLSNHLKMKYGLHSQTSRAIPLGRPELLLMIKSCYDYPASWEVALQETTLFLMFWYTSVRPGSLLPTKTYKHHLTWKDIEVKPIYLNGVGADKGHLVLYGFSVNITIDTFKGYQYLQGMNLVYQARPVTQAKNILIDLDNTAMALALRRGLVEGYRNMESLRLDRPRIIRRTADGLKAPVFVAKMY